MKTTVVLLVLAVLLGGAYLVLGRLGPSNPSLQTKPLLPAAQWNQVSITVGQSPTRVMRLTPDRTWEQFEPQWCPVDPGKIASLLSSLSSMTILEEFANPSRKQLEEMSLSPPTAEVRLIGDQGAFVIYLGDRTQTGAGYIQTDTGVIGAIVADLHDMVYLSDPVQWRSRATRLPAPEQLDRLDIQLNERITPIRPGFNPFTLARDGRVWWYGNTAGQRASSDAITLAIQQLRTAEPAWLPDAGNTPAASLASAYGLSEPQAVVTMTEPTGRQLRITTGRAADLKGLRQYARIDASIAADPQTGADWRLGPIFTVPREALQAWAVPGDRWREPRVFDTTYERFTEMSITRNHPDAADDALGVVRREPSGLSGSGVFQDQAQEKLDVLLALRAERFDVGFATQDLPAFVVALRSGLSESSTTRVYRFGNDSLWHRDGETVAYRFANEALPPWLHSLIESR